MRIFCRPVCTSTQLVAWGMQFWASTGISFDHSTLGTTPNIVPPSDRNRPPETVVTVNCPSFMVIKSSGGGGRSSDRGSGGLGLLEAEFLDHDLAHAKLLKLTGDSLWKLLHQANVSRHLVVRQ